MAYNSYDHDSLKHGNEMKIERRLSFDSNKADISHLTALSSEQLHTMRMESEVEEMAAYDNVREAANEWEKHAGNTLLLSKAIEYNRTPPVQHTANEWQPNPNNSDHHTRSNAVYAMSYNIYERTRYDNEAQKSVPVAWSLTWRVITQSPGDMRGSRIAGQDRKVYTNKADMEKYLNGRIKAFSHLFTEISPPIPKEHAACFRVNGQLLQGYTVEGEAPQPPQERAADIGGVFISTENEPRKEHTTMFEPMSIKIATPENAEGGVWLRLPATAEQLSNALERIGAQDDKFIISEVEPNIRLSAACVDNATIEQLNHLSAIAEDFTAEQAAKLNAIIAIMPDPENINSIIGHACNVDFHEHYPDINTHAELGEHVFAKSGLIQIPEEWAGAVDREKLGQLAAENEKGIFTENGYIVESGAEWKPITEIPQDYQLTRHFDFDFSPIPTPAVDTADPPQQAQTAAAVAPAPFVLIADNPRDRMKEITDKLVNGVKGIYESEQYKTVLKTLSKFHNYSLNNCLLIAMQNPAATHVGGFTFWRDKMKSPVKPGEKGMKIIAPSPFKTKKMVDAVDAGGKPIFKDGRRVKEEKEVTVPAFRVATVYDVSQTEGEPLPQLGVSELTGSVEQYKDFYAAVEKVSPVPVDFEKIPTGAKGYFSIEEKRIAINEGMSELQNLKTLIHEIAHARIHDIDKNAPKNEARPDRNTREVEAESIAYAVCQHYGLDTSEYSFGYVASWSGDKQIDTLKSSLDTIRKEAGAIITEIDKNFAELSQDKVQTAEQTAPKLQGDTFTIYQLKDGDETRGLRFEPLTALKESPNMANYDKAYTATLENGTTLEKIFTDFNTDKPEDFKGHSLSISDVVVINRDGKETAHYVDGAGFKDLPNFLPQKEQAQEKTAEQKGNQLWQDYTAVTQQHPNSIVFNKLGDFYEVMGDKASIVANQLGLALTGRDVGLPERVPLVGVPAHNFDKVIDELVKNNYTVAIAEKLNVTERTPPTQPPQSIDLKIVADYMQRQYDYANGADPNNQTATATVSIITRRLEQSSERIPETQPQLKALLTHAAQSPDLPTLQERMNTLHTEFIQHHSTTAKDTTPPRGENVAAIEAKVSAGETINLSDLSDAMKKDKQAAQQTQQANKATGKTTGKTAQGKTTQSRAASSRGKTTEQPSIKDKIAAGKKQLATQKSAPQKAAAKNRNTGLGD